MVSSTILIGLFASVAVARPGRRQGSGTVTCPIVLDGRVPADTELTDFDSYATSPFNPDYIRGDEKFSQTLLFPDVSNSRFDDDAFKSIEVTINDESIFQTQNGFRRIGLQIQVMGRRYRRVCSGSIINQLCPGGRERERPRNDRSEDAALECQAGSRAHIKPYSRVLGMWQTYRPSSFMQVLTGSEERLA